MYNQFFINSLLRGTTTIKKLIDTNWIEDENDIILLDKMRELGILDTTLIHIIITEDTQSITLNDFINTLTDDNVGNIEECEKCKMRTRKRRCSYLPNHNGCTLRLLQSNSPSCWNEHD